MNQDKIPVFIDKPFGETSLSECLGWVDDEIQACELLLQSRAKDGLDLPGIGKAVFGGVLMEHIRVATDDGPYRDAKGLYRWQRCFCPFYDTPNLAGKPTKLYNVYVYKS